MSRHAPVAELTVVSVGPLVSFQDGGRHGQLRFGVPASGPMDTLAHAVANTAVGNPVAATAIEISRGGVELRCDHGSVTAAVAGGGFDLSANGRALSSWSTFTLDAGDVVRLRAGDPDRGGWGSWAYLSLAGDVAAPRWLGSTSTHSTSGQGGGLLRPGHRVMVGQARTSPDLDGPLPEPALARPTPTVAVVPGPQTRRFVDEAVDRFLTEPYRLTSHYDRMGARLEGPKLALREALAIASEPIVRGSVQVAGDGVPTVLLADHQTTGGYPKIATLLACEVDRFVQHQPGDEVRFEPVSPAEAIELARGRAGERDAVLAELARTGRTLAQRLMGHNLIGSGYALVDPVDDA